jgi:hypothetical protein
MSWLRNHFHEFVYPAFLAADKKSTEIGSPFHIEVSKHAPERLPTELKKLWTLCREHAIQWSYDVRAPNLHGGTSKYRESARIQHRILVSSLESAVAAMRDEGCDRILLPGRDIYALSVLCARRKVPFLFVPELSRIVSEKASVRALLESRGFTGRELLVDTGYAGSIPRNLREHFPGCHFKYRLLSQTDRFPIQNAHRRVVSGQLVDVNVDSLPRNKYSNFERRPNQFFPNRQKAREEAMQSEYLAKYWKGGTHDSEGNIVQYLADKSSIQRAALLTSMLFRGIPYWKVSGPRETGLIYNYNFATGNVNAGNNTGNVVLNTATNGIITNTVTTFLGPIAGQVQTLGLAQAQAALAAVPQLVALPPGPV